MFERLLNKEVEPSFLELITYCGENGNRFEELNNFLESNFNTIKEIRFPYGNKYGWSACHRKGKQLICDIFAENGAFNVMLRLTDSQFMSLYENLNKHTKKCIDGRYPCGNGGWIHYRVENDEDLKDIKALLSIKCGLKK